MAIWHNVPVREEIWKALSKMAEEDNRSVANEVESILKEKLGNSEK